jgi:DNA-directed RNA polymerase specialized sigma24 family protein
MPIRLYPSAKEDDIILKSEQEHPLIFGNRFSRCHRLLHFMACRVLGGPERAEDAIGNCWLAAFRNPPKFEYEGAFRSWLLRSLIDQAMAIRRHDEETTNRSIRRQASLEQYEWNSNPRVLRANSGAGD